MINLLVRVRYKGEQNLERARDSIECSRQDAAERWSAWLDARRESMRARDFVGEPFASRGQLWPSRAAAGRPRERLFGGAGEQLFSAARPAIANVINLKRRPFLRARAEHNQLLPAGGGSARKHWPRNTRAEGALE